MALTSVLNRQTAQPRDLSQRLLARLYPESPYAPSVPQTAPTSTAPVSQPQAQQSPTGLPIYQPPPPQAAPVTAPQSSGRAGLSQGAMQPQGQIPSYGGQPQTTGGSGGLVGSIRKSFPQTAPPNPWGDLSWDQQKMLSDYFGSLAGIDYKGSRESAQMQQAALAQMLRGWNMEGPVDYTSAAPMADQFDHSRGQLEASLAARGLNGGVVGGALSNSYSQEARGIGDYIRQLLSERQQQHHSDYQRFLDWTRQLNGMGLQKNIDEQNSGNFLDDLLGVGTGILGKVL